MSMLCSQPQLKGHGSATHIRILMVLISIESLPNCQKYREDTEEHRAGKSCPTLTPLSLHRVCIPRTPRCVHGHWTLPWTCSPMDLDDLWPIESEGAQSGTDIWSLAIFTLYFVRSRNSLPSGLSFTANWSKMSQTSFEP